MPKGDDGPLVLDISLHIEKLKKDVKKADSTIKKFGTDTEKGQTKSLKVLRSTKGTVDSLGKAWAAAEKAAKAAGAATVDAAQKTGKLLKQNIDTGRKNIEQLKEIGRGAKRLGQMDVGRGFFGGLMRGTGVAGVYGAIRRPERRQRLGAAIGRGIVGAGAGIAGFIVGGLQQAYGTYLQYGQATFGAAGMGASRADIRRGQAAMGRYGFGAIETAGMRPTVAAATGALGATNLAQALTMGAGFGPGRFGEAAGFMGVMREGGARFRTRGELAARGRDLTKMFAEGMSTGLERAKIPDFFRATASLMQQSFQFFSGKVGADPIRKQLGMLMRGGVGGGSAQRAGQVLGQLDRMIRAPGGGMAGQATVLQAFGFGRPGGATGYYEALREQQKGIAGPEGARRLAKVFQEVNRQRGVIGAGGKDPMQQEANLQLSVMSGLSLDIVEQLQDIYNSDKSVEEKVAEAEKVLKKTEPIEKQALAETKKGFTGVKQHLVGIEKMNIKIGAKIAPQMMELQKFQLRIVSEVADYLPQVIDLLKKIYNLIKVAVAWFKPGGITRNLQAIEDALDAQEKAIKKQVPTSLVQFVKTQKALEQRAIARKEIIRQRLSMRKLELTREGVVGDWLPFNPAVRRAEIRAKQDIAEQDIEAQERRTVAERIGHVTDLEREFRRAPRAVRERIIEKIEAMPRGAHALKIRAMTKRELAAGRQAAAGESIQRIRRGEYFRRLTEPDPSILPPPPASPREPRVPQQPPSAQKSAAELIGEPPAAPIGSRRP